MPVTPPEGRRHVKLAVWSRVYLQVYRTDLGSRETNDCGEQELLRLRRVAALMDAL